jgi:Carboxypeptidase regulatory-like domain
MRTRTRARLGALAFAAIAFLLAAAPAAAKGGTIDGKVVNGTADDPVGGLEVTLTVTDDAGQTTATATTDDNGAFAFPALATGATSFAVSATYEGATFSTPELSADAAGTPVTLKVFEPTTEPSDVTQTSWVVWVDRENTSVAVQQDIEWKNQGDRAYVGASSGGPVTRMQLAPGATNFQFLGLYLQRPGRVEGTTFVDTAPLLPGTTQATVRYTTEALDALAFPVALATDSFRLFVPADVTVESSALTAMGQTTDRGITYAIYGASDLSSGDRIEVALSGLSGSSGTPPGLVILVGSVMVLALGVFVVWRVGRVRGPRRGQVVTRRSASRVGRGSPRPSRPAARATNASRVRGNGHRRDADEDDEDVELLIDEIAALDLSFERGVLDERTHRALRAAAKRRLLRARGASGSGARR